MDAELKQYLDTMTQELRQHTEAVETRLLGEFWKWARTADARYRQHRGAVTSLDERVALAEDRISELERGK